ncbi:MAG: hypothetical protein ACLPN1_07445 [Dissulfurispiraceae bacterium]
MTSAVKIMVMRVDEMIGKGLSCKMLSISGAERSILTGKGLMRNKRSIKEPRTSQIAATQ